MKPTIKSISPRKFYRLKGTYGTKACVARVFNDDTWEAVQCYQAFIYNDHVYTCERTKERNFSTVFKRYPLGYSTVNKCLLISNTGKGVL